MKEFYRVLELEAAAITSSLRRFQTDPALQASLESSLNLIHERSKKGGRVLVLGVGKSGKIGSKIAATLSSTGTPALFVHPTEALHGDLGVVSDSDVAIVISYTGNTEELLSLVPFFERRNVPLIGIIGNLSSKLAQKCTFSLDASVSEEACSHNLAPTTSTTVALAIGDAIAITLMKKKDFTAEDFAKNHPGGSLGKRLQLLVKDLMHDLEKSPVVAEQTPMNEILKLSTERKLGAVLVCDGPLLKGIITDGDIRRALAHQEKFFGFTARDIMTKSPITVNFELLAYNALRIMEDRESQISVLPVTNDQGHALGLIRIHDLVQTL